MRKNDMDPWEQREYRRRRDQREERHRWRRRRNLDSELGCIGYMLFGLVMIGFIVFGSCAGCLEHEDTAIRALETQGFSNIRIVDKGFLFVRFKGGGNDDNVKFTAYATNPAGENVTVCVFAGWPWKGATVRTP